MPCRQYDTAIERGQKVQQSQRQATLCSARRHECMSAGNGGRILRFF